MAFLVTDLTSLPPAMREAVHKVCTDENGFAMMQAKLRQQRTAQFWKNFDARSRDGLGSPTLDVDPYWVRYFKATYGTDPITDTHFRRWLKRQGEDQYFVQARGTRIQVQCPGLPGKRTFRKSYNEP